MQPLLVNQIWQHSNSHYRILYISKDIDQVFWININDENKLPEAISYESLLDEISNSQITIIEDNLIYADPSDYKPASLEKWKKYCEVIDLIEGCEPLIFVNKIFNQKCSEISNSTKFSRQSVRRIILKYFKKGKNRLGLLPELINSGARGKRVDNPKNKLGRRNKYSVQNNFTINEGNRRVIENGYKKFYLDVEQASLNTAYENFLAVIYPESLKGNFENVPSLMQFRRTGELKFKIENRLRAKKGDKIFDKDMRTTSESSKINTIGPGSLWQIDSTTADIELVSQIDRSIPIGSPTLYFVSDVFSHAIVGVLVTLDEPSFYTAAQALYNSIVQKELVIKEAGLEDVTNFFFYPEEWNMYGLPNAVVADRAELLKNKSNNIIRDLGISIENTPSYRADLKGIVENHFNELHAKLRGAESHFGIKSTNHRQRGVRDARLDACLTLKEYYAIIIRSIIDYNNTKLQDKYPKDADMIKAKIQAVPKTLYNWGIENRSGIMRMINLDQLKVRFLPIEKGALTKDGFRFKNGWYNLPRGCSLENEMIRTQDKRIYFEAYYNPHILDEVYIKLENEIITARLSVSKNPSLVSLSLWEREAHIEDEKYRSYEQRETNRTANINTAIFTKNIIENAKNQQPKKKRSKNLKSKSIRKNKAKEKEILKTEKRSQIENPSYTNESKPKKETKVISINSRHEEKIDPKPNNSKSDFFRRLMEDE
ncbi:hypothetical protein GCM10027429_02930 [Marivirga atlantica]|uniref:DDE-type integrase/transposase/recombinase n=1 Tax=Marivirga atlantica TaxID=1548457 RepID=A0A937A821_9BACT|nr:DDE-type integrase/transposase/recombinase [Marivirga atlantica]MBL0763905.1 DDE-type integrase/transposase/recombinase [Marivirga atlantica]